MGERLRADLTRIGEVAAQITQIGTDFSQATTLAEGYASARGSAQLAGVLSTFADGWSIHRQRAFGYSQGQPWLVNALAREVVVKMGVSPPEPVTAAHIDEAKERLILAQSTHLDCLATRLAEPRVKRVIQPLIAGEFVGYDPTYNDDVSYVRDLGLVGEGRPIAVANPIYRDLACHGPAPGSP